MSLQRFRPIPNIFCCPRQGKSESNWRCRNVATEELIVNRYSVLFQSCLHVREGFSVLGLTRETFDGPDSFPIWPVKPLLRFALRQYRCSSHLLNLWRRAYRSVHALEQPMPAETSFNCWLDQGRDYSRGMSRLVPSIRHAF